MVKEYDRSSVPTVHDLEQVPAIKEEPGLRQAIFRGIDQMIALTTIGPEREEAEPHSHPWEQMNMLVKGRLDLLVGEERISMEPYDTVMIPPDVPHASRTISDEPAVMVEFWPLREDYLPGTEYQTEFDA